ncbi:PREDICTED: placenta-specific protein 1 [Dipodomys ordii]|uniref:Placenta-specific protein 1 n=1 Tax=Dipodomys ordii TaxID=10020 RepID=A0A1S3FA32_DIPOR|nr:PREDICTED: placenta-specific protein 1 [Dipodomys ordii]XP_042528578.1 placenta-specific protein 1 [Dipodomys spectabilis]XP_042528579.1 placenta-specific protein 1 [Dipodomys spectabilis]
MKVFELVGGLIFFAAMFAVCSGQSSMTVLCSMDWFMVTVHPFMLNNDVYVHFYELHLGLGCPPNHVQSHFYQFTYRVTECGIRAKAVSEDIVIYSTEIHYASKGTSSRYVIPVSCAAPRRSPWLTKPYSMRVAKESSAVAQKGKPCCEMLNSSNQRPVCDCPPYVFNEDRTQNAPQQAEAQGARPMPSPQLPAISSEDWCLRSDDLMGPM